jgi:hypothetical protein
MDCDQKRKLTKLDLGSANDPKNVLISLTLPSQFVTKIEALLHNYKDVFGTFSLLLCFQKLVN